MRYVNGAGLRKNHPCGPIRFDSTHRRARTKTAARFRFSIGVAF
jgi:hypothetical protein